MSAVVEIESVLDLDGPPVVGRAYLVPCVWYSYAVDVDDDVERLLVARRG